MDKATLILTWAYDCWPGRVEQAYWYTWKFTVPAPVMPVVGISNEELLRGR